MHHPWNQKPVITLVITQKNTLRYINVDKIHDYLGDRMCHTLPALHIFTGSDYTAAFNKKGKVKPSELLQDNVNFQNAFSALGSKEVVDGAIQEVIESFVCLWYSQLKKVTKLADACLNSFLKSYKTKKNDFQSIEGCDASLMPLCGAILLEKITL